MEGNNLEDPSVGGKTILKKKFKKWDRGVWSGLFCLRKGSGEGLLRMWY